MVNGYVYMTTSLYNNHFYIKFTRNVVQSLSDLNAKTFSCVLIRYWECIDPIQNYLFYKLSSFKINQYENLYLFSSQESAIKIIDSLFNKYIEKEIEKINQETLKKHEEVLQLQCLIEEKKQNKIMCSRITKTSCEI